MWPWRKHQHNPTPPPAPVEIEEPNDEVVTCTYTGFGSVLALMQMDATVTIESGPYEGLTAVVTGYESRLAKLMVNTTVGLCLTDEDTALVLATIDDSEDFWALVWRLIRPSANTIRELLTSGAKRHLQVKITVPERTAISLRDFSGTVTASGQYAVVDAEVSDDTVLTLGAITGLTLETGDRAEVTIENLTGDCKVTLGYDSALKVASGALEGVDLDAAESCKFDFQTSCDKVTYVAADSTELRISTVLSELSAEVDAESIIHLDCRGADSVDITAGTDCAITCKGSVASVSLDVDSSTEVTLGSVTGELNVEAGYECKVITTAGSGTPKVNISMDDAAELHLIGDIQEGSIDLGEDSDVFVGRMPDGVSVHFGGDTRLRTGYLVVE